VFVVKCLEVVKNLVRNKLKHSRIEIS